MVVEKRLIDAGSTLIRNKDWSGVPTDIADYWRSISMSFLDIGGLWPYARFWPLPARETVILMWDAWGWLRFASAENAQLIIMRSVYAPNAQQPVVDWLMAARRRRQSVRECKADYELAIGQIARALGRTEEAITAPPGVSARLAGPATPRSPAGKGAQV